MLVDRLVQLIALRVKQRLEDNLTAIRLPVRAEAAR